MTSDTARPGREGPSARTDGAAPRTRSAALGEWLCDRYLRLDVRWLGVFRIALGSLLIVEVLRRWYYARAFYTNEGLLPNHYSLFAPMGRNVFSIYHAFSSYGEVSVAFFLTLLVFLAFTLGYRTKLFHFVSAVCITSLNARNLFVENGGTVVVNILTVYTLFLPLGERFSLDAVRSSLRRRADRSVLDLNRPDPARAGERTTSFVVLLLLVQWSAIYFFNTVQKDGAGWRDGTALHWFFHQDRIITWFGIWAREHLPLSAIRAMTYGALVVEGTLSALILFPFFQKYTRRAILLLVWALHGFIALSARIGPFSYVMMLFPILLLGAEDFAWVTRPFRSERRARRVVVSAESPLAFRVARLLDRLDPFERLTFIDSREAARLPPDPPKDPLWVIDPQGVVLRGRVAWLELTRALPFGIVLRFLLRLPGVSWLFGRFCSEFSRRHRRWSAALGVTVRAADPSTARLVEPTRSTVFERGVAEVRSGLREALVLCLGVAVVAAIFVQNSFVSQHVKVRRSEWMTAVVEYPRLLQGWSMFAPEPPYEDGRVVIDGRTADGRKLDPFSGGPPNLDPEAPRGWGHSQFWCDYHNRIRYRDSASHRQHLRNYLLHQHELSGRSEDRLVAFDVWWVQDRSPAPGVARGQPLPPEKLLSYGTVQDSSAAPWLSHPRPDEGQRDAPLLGP